MGIWMLSPFDWASMSGVSPSAWAIPQRVSPGLTRYVPLERTVVDVEAAGATLGAGAEALPVDDGRRRMLPARSRFTFLSPLARARADWEMPLRAAMAVSVSPGLTT